MKISRLTAVCAGAVLFGASTLHAAPIGFGFNAGPVTSIRNDAPAAIQLFQLGEDIFIEFTIDENAIDESGALGSSDFADSGGTLKITGLTSGAMLNIFGGVEIEFDSTGEFELESDLDAPDAANPFVMTDDTDYRTVDGALGSPIISDPDDLSGSLAELEALLNSDDLFTILNFSTADAGIDYFDSSTGGILADVIEFGPVPTGDPDPDPSVIPLPASAFLLVAALGGLGALRRRKS